jgi:hypothetical protein
MKPLPAAGLLILGTTLGLVLGRTTATKSGGPAESETTTEKARTNKRARSAGADSSTNGIERIRKAKPGELPGLTRIAINLSDPVEMRRQLTECLLHMDAENWQEVVEAFAKLSRETGRDQGDEWKLSLFRSGQVAGEQAMNLRLKDGLDKKSDANWHTLYGWSTKDSHGALDWLRKAEADGHPVSSECYGAIISGAALTDPKDALKLLAEIPAERRGGCAGNLTWNVVQSGGVEALDQVLDFASKLDKSDPRNEQFAESLLSQSADKLLWKADHALDVQQACEVVSKLVDYGQDPTDITSRALQKYRWYGMPEKLRLLNTVNSSNEAANLNLPMLTSFVLGTMNGDGDKVAVIEWMDKNPDSPLVPLIEKRVPRSQ